MNNLLINILSFIDNNLYTQISINDLSNRFFYNKDYIMRIFKKEFGMTIIEYINKKRVYNSLKDLKETDYYILKISILYGFTSQEYYSETFTKIMGVSPQVYRKFCKNSLTISYEEISIIRKNLTNLNYEINKIEKYKTNISTETIKKKSLY